jgi:type I restriction enzyme S subunit
MELLATAPGGVAKLRELILTLAVQGKLVPQDPADEPAGVLLQKIRAEKDRLIAEGKIKRDKPLAEIAEEEKPFELPQGWEWVRLSALLQKIGAGSTPLGGREVYVSSGVKFLRSQNVWDEGLRLDGVAFIKPETHAKMAGTVVVANDLLFNITGASIGRCAVVPSDFDEANVSQHVTIIRAVLPEVNAFLHKVLVSRHVQQTVMDVQVGVSREGLSIAKLGQFLIPLPPLAEQSRIVTRVEALMRLCDALEAKGQLEAAQHAQLVSTLLGTLTASTTPDELAAHWQRVAQHFDLLLDRPEAIDALEQTLLQLAVRGVLVPQDPTDEPASALLQKIRAEKDRLIATGQIKQGKPLPPITDEEKPFELPVGWEWVRFGEYFFELCTGPFGSVIHKEDYVEDGIPLINPSHMIGGRISHDPSVSVSQEMSKQLGAYRLTVGDVVLARRGEVGRYALVTEAEDGWLCGTGSFFVKLQESCNREFFGLVLEDPDLRRHLQGESVGSTMVNLNQRILLETPMALPPLAEQSRIVTRVTALRRLCADLRQRLAERQSVQARLAEALVGQAGST